LSSTNFAICNNPIFREYPKWVPTFSHSGAPRLPVNARQKNTTPASAPQSRRQYPAQTIHNPPKLYIMYVMRLLRKQLNNATESPAVKLDKKIKQKDRRQSLALDFPRFSTAFSFILPIALSFYR